MYWFTFTWCSSIGDNNFPLALWKYYSIAFCHLLSSMRHCGTWNNILNPLLVMALKILSLLSFIVFIKDINYELLWFKFLFTSMALVPLFTFRHFIPWIWYVTMYPSFVFEVWFFHEGELFCQFSLSYWLDFLNGVIAATFQLKEVPTWQDGLGSNGLEVGHGELMRTAQDSGTCIWCIPHPHVMLSALSVYS